MCTVVIDVPELTDGAGVVRLLAVRDEDPQREWDDLGAWWPEQYPGVIGIRDRRAGGAWLAVDPERRRLAVLLNRADVPGLPPAETVSRGGLALESVRGESPTTPPRTHGFNLLEVTPDGARVLSWDGAMLRETPVPSGTHMIAHDDLDDPGTARIATWLPRFRAEPVDAENWAVRWTDLLARSTSLPPEDDRAIIRDNRVHGYPTLSLLYTLASVGAEGTHVDSHVLAHPGHWD